MDRDERQLRTVHEMDLDKLLDSFGVRESFDSGKILCKFCRSTVMAKDNIYSLFKESGAISFVCDKPACITESLLYLEDKKKTLKNDE